MVWKPQSQHPHAAMVRSLYQTRQFDRVAKAGQDTGRDAWSCSKPPFLCVEHYLVYDELALHWRAGFYAGEVWRAFLVVESDAKKGHHIRGNHGRTCLPFAVPAVACGKVASAISFGPLPIRNLFQLVVCCASGSADPSHAESCTSPCRSEEERRERSLTDMRFHLILCDKAQDHARHTKTEQFIFELTSG